MTTTDYHELKLSHEAGARYRLELRQHWFPEGEEMSSAEAATVTFGEDFITALLEHSGDPTEAARLILAHLGVLKKALERDLHSSLAAGCAMRLRLIIEGEAPDLHRVPWELLLHTLFEGMRAQGLPGATRHLYFSRYLSPKGKVPRDLRPRNSLRYLVATASPHDLGAGLLPISAEAEADRVSQALRQHAAVATLPESAAGTLARLAAALHDGTVTDVLCLVAHGAFKPSEMAGGEALATLVLETDEGKAIYVPATDLVAVIANAPQLPRVVILGSCESAGDTHGDMLLTLGPLLADLGVPAVVAMQGKIQHATFAAFLSAFLPTLAATGEADLAMAAARSALIDTHEDWWQPVLFQRTRFGKIWSESNAVLLAKAQGWLRRHIPWSAPEARLRLAQSILACPAAATMEWAELKGLDELLDELEESPGNTVALADLNETIAQALPHERISFGEARTLRALLCDVWLQSGQLSELYGWIKPPGDAWAPPVYDDRPGRLAAVVTSLAWAGPSLLTDLPPLTALVDMLLQPAYENASVKAVAVELRAWRARVAPDVPTAGRAIASSGRPYLQMQIRPARDLTGEPRFMCHGWLRYDGASTPAQDQPLGSVHDQYAPGELPAAFRAVVRQGMQHLPRPEELPGGAEGLRIEVFLPMSLLLTLPVDQWRVDFSGRRGMRAGIRHQVVVRSLERAQPGHNVGARADWSAKWQHLGGRWREAVCDALSWLPPPPEADPDILSVKLLSARVVAVGQPWCPGGDPAAPALLVKLGAAPEDPDLLATLSGLPEDPDLLDVLDSVFSAGVPVALAVRLDDEPPADARAALLASLQEATLAELPETVLAQRREAVGDTSHFGGRLTLLWDDPGRPPPTITYTSGE